MESAEIDDRGLARARRVVRGRDIEGRGNCMEASGIGALGEVLEAFGLGQVETCRSLANGSPRPQRTERPLGGGASTLGRCRKRSISLENVGHARIDGRSSAENAEGAVDVLDEHDIELAYVPAEPLA